jgi:predicted nucleic acid-binding protein
MSNANPERCFIDINIWLYAFIEGEDAEKTRKAKHVIATHEVTLSTQVINEMCVNLLRNADFTEEQLRELIVDLYNTYRVVELNQPAQVKASELRERYNLSFWDSTIVANALLSDVRLLYSEDMHDGLVVEDKMSIQNPLK